MRIHRCPIHLVLVWLIASSLGPLHAQEQSPSLPNFDIRRVERTNFPRLDTTRQSALNRLQARIPGLKLDLDDVFVSPKFVCNQLGFLSGPASEDEILKP